MLFRRATIAKITYYDIDPLGNTFDELYRGWTENYDPSKCKNLYNSYDNKHKIYSK